MVDIQKGIVKYELLKALISLRGSLRGTLMLRQAD